MILFGLTTSTFVNNNVIFQKKNEFSTSRSRWLVTFVIEFQAYFDFINAIEKDVKYNNARENLYIFLKCRTTQKCS